MTGGRSVSDAVAQSLRGRVREVLLPGDTGYDAARTVWNARFDRRPAAIARCAGSAEVSAAVTAAREGSLRFAVRSGGHDYAGHSSCDDGLLIDLSPMDGVRVDASARRVYVGPGVRWGAVDRATQPFGLATPGGTVSTVGVAGYTLGGGTGWLSRRHGLALDSLRSAEVVLASGDVVRASEREHDDLFWGIRGGSGNLGIVSAFEFELYDVGPEVLAGQIIYPLEHARDVLRGYRRFMSEAPDDLQCYAFLLRIPPLDVFPDAFHNKVVIDLAVAWLGDERRGEEALAPIRRLGPAVLDTVAAQPFVALQQAFDAGMPAGNRWYTRAHYLRELPEEAIDTILRFVEDLPGPFTLVYLEPGGGAVARVPVDATAFPHRTAPFSLHILPGWQAAGDDERMIDWARGFHGAMAPFSTGGAYVNLVDADEADAARRAYGANHSRLTSLKQAYDPDNLFRANHNIVVP